MLPFASVAAQEAAGGDFITHHITDSYMLEVPTLTPPFATEICLGKHVGEHGCVSPIDDFHIDFGLFTLSGNLWPTKHTVMLALAATIMALILVLAARAARRQTSEHGHSKGFAGAIEAVVVYLRNEVILPNVGHHGEAFVPYLLGVFFFILGANLLGMIPYAATATGNIAVTATLAILTFLVIEISGIVANGFGYLNTIIYWNTELSLPLRVPLAIIVSPIEMIGKLTKPFALAIRLFANMTAGHIVILALIGLIFSFGSYAIAGAPVLMAVAINLLELMVAFLQAFIFTMLASVFIGQVREAHH
ncbi:MAG: F0F1 ATP synthase subunit A [Gemmatimonadaceae bacterium]|nr:F0F1 ATP synthase subunit A [Gemmatimonadaceae bacterium]